jgi:Rps23 Pro-64 3,4-dihydroxylase Tpa1-like proline 4-hydroxylase
VPKAYSGGALLLFDGDMAEPTRLIRDSFTSLDTVDNSIVFFPSATFHEVTPVVNPSGYLEDARFTFAGHVHAVEDDGVMRTTPVS